MSLKKLNASGHENIGVFVFVQSPFSSGQSVVSIFDFESSGSLCLCL